MSYELKIICASYADLAALVKHLDVKHTAVTMSAKPTPGKSYIEATADIDVLTGTVEELAEEVAEAITGTEVEQALRKLNQTIDRAAVTKITEMCGVKKISLIPVNMYPKVMARISELMNPEVEENDDGLFSDSDGLEETEVEETEVETPTDSMLKKMAGAMNTESRRDYKELLTKYKCKSAKSFVNLSDENKVKIFAEMNKYLA